MINRDSAAQRYGTGNDSDLKQAGHKVKNLSDCRKPWRDNPCAPSTGHHKQTMADRTATDDLGITTAQWLPSWRKSIGAMIPSNASRDRSPCSRLRCRAIRYSVESSFISFKATCRFKVSWANATRPLTRLSQHIEDGWVMDVPLVLRSEVVQEGQLGLHRRKRKDASHFR